MNWGLEHDGLDMGMGCGHGGVVKGVVILPWRTMIWKRPIQRYLITGKNIELVLLE